GHDLFGLMARYDFGPDSLRWSVGGDVQYADGYLKEIQTRPTFGVFPQGIHYDYDVETLMFAAYGELDWDFAPDWSRLAGLRAESHTYDYSPSSPSGVNGRLRVPASRGDR